QKGADPFNKKSIEVLVPPEPDPPPLCATLLPSAPSAFCLSCLSSPLRLLRRQLNRRIIRQPRRLLLRRRLADGHRAQLVPTLRAWGIGRQPLEVVPARRAYARRILPLQRYAPHIAIQPRRRRTLIALLLLPHPLIA